MKRWAWKKPVAVAVTWCFSLSQMVPLAGAAQSLRPVAERQGGAATGLLERELGFDLGARQAVARARAAELPNLPQHTSHRLTNVAYSPSVAQDIQRRLDAKVQDGTLVSASVAEANGKTEVTVRYRDATPNPRIDRLLVDTVSEVVPAVAEALQPEAPQGTDTVEPDEPTAEDVSGPATGGGPQGGVMSIEGARFLVAQAKSGDAAVREGGLRRLARFEEDQRGFPTDAFWTVMEAAGFQRADIDALLNQAAQLPPAGETSPVELATLEAHIANPKAGPLYLGPLVPKAASVAELVDSLRGIVDLDPDTGGVSRIRNEQRLRTEAVHQLAAESSMSPNADVRAAAQWLLRDLGRNLGTGEASAYELHKARAEGRWGHATIPAFNIRTGPPYHTLMTLFDAAIEQNVGLLMIEIAKSEQGYAIDIEEYVAAVYAAAMARGFTGALLIQADHYQLAPADYNKPDPPGTTPGTMRKKAVDAMKAHLRRSMDAGMLNLDPDSSTLVDHKIVEDKILPLKMEYTNRYIQTRMTTNADFAQWIAKNGGLKPQMYGAKEEDRESGEIRALRHKLWDDLLMVALESAGTGILEEVLGQGALRMPELQAYLDQLELTIEEEKARYKEITTDVVTGTTSLGEGHSYNSPELYELPAAGYHDSLRQEGVAVTAQELRQLIGLYRDMQRDNLAVSREFLLDIHQHERQRGLPTSDRSLEEEHTDTDVLVNAHPSSALGIIVFTGLALKSCERDKVAPFTTVALQTGTMHGVGGNPDWGVHVRANLAMDGSGIAGTDQHGTSTVAPDRFADMPAAGVLSDHLATEYQKYTFAVMAQDGNLVDQVGQFLEGVLFKDRITDPDIRKKVENAKGAPSGDKLKKFQDAWEQAMREGQDEKRPGGPLTKRQIVANLITDSKDLGKVKGKLKDVTKLASKPFAVEISQLPPELKAQNYLQHVAEFRRIFRVQNVTNSRGIVEQYAGFDAAKVVLPPPPTGLVQAMRRRLSREAAEVVANEHLTTRANKPKQPIPAPGKDNTIAIGVANIALRGNTAIPKGDKDTAAEEASDAITIARGDVEHVMAIEGELDVSYDELAAGGVHETGFIVNPHGTGADVSAIRDDIEVTNAFHGNREGRPHDPSTSNPGTTSLRVWGDGVKQHGVVPEKYAAIIAANVPPAKVREYDERPLDPFAWDPVDPHDGLLQTITRLTSDSGREIWDTEVVIMKRGRETAVKQGLDRIAAEHVGPNGEHLLITEVSDGTVDPARLAMAGRKDGRYLIAIEMGKSTEGTHNWFESAALRYRGGVIGMRPVSKNINNTMKAGAREVEAKDGATDHRNRLAWTAKEEQDERAFRPRDAEARLAGKVLYHQGNVPGDVEIAVGMRTDNPWFNLPGDLDMGDGDTVRVWTMRMSSQAARANGTDLWVEVDEASRREIGLKIRGAAYHSLPNDAQLQIQTSVVGALIREELLRADDQAAIEVIRDAAARLHPEYRGKAIKKLGTDEVVRRIVGQLGESTEPQVRAIVQAAMAGDQDQIAGTVQGAVRRVFELRKEESSQPINEHTNLSQNGGQIAKVLGEVAGALQIPAGEPRRAFIERMQQQLPQGAVTVQRLTEVVRRVLESDLTVEDLATAMTQAVEQVPLLAPNPAESGNARTVLRDAIAALRQPGAELPANLAALRGRLQDNQLAISALGQVKDPRIIRYLGGLVTGTMPTYDVRGGQSVSVAGSYLDRVKALGVETDDPARLQQGALVTQFPQMAEAMITPDEAASAVDIRDQRLIVVHASVQDGTLDGTPVQERLRDELQYVQGGSTNGALHFVRVNDVNEISQALASVPGSRVASVVGPRAFVEAVKADRANVIGIVVEPAQPEGKVASGGNGIRVAVSAATSKEGRPDPDLAVRLKVAEEAGLFVPEPLDMLEETQAVVQQQHEERASVHNAATKE